jgi:CRP-like cAMP-binding protein
MPLNIMERVIFLRSAALSSNLPDPALRVLAEVAHEQAIPAGRTIFAEEDIGNELFLIVDGEVEVRKLGLRPAPDASGDGLGVLLTVLKKGDVVGEMSVLDDQPRSATIVAKTDVVALSLHREDLRDAIALCPDLAFGLFRVLSSRLRATSATSAIPKAAVRAATRRDRDS